jgi:hypothetical protein
MKMDLTVTDLDYSIWLRALWGVPSLLSQIDMDAMVREARRRGSEADLELILALRMVKGEEHTP